jgi:anaerobic magnesium-protoporphyrin IX monomethyl ester cyclase
LCHFTSGGNYASLRYEELFNLVPSLDSAVRFEGENTLLELVNCICSGNDWRKVTGIAYKNVDGEIIANPLRPIEKDLDNFPFPMRSPLKEYAFNRKFATILAGRGCLYNCAFCNLRQFYHTSSGPLKRVRRPEMVVKEMEFLYYEKGCSIFLFEDDDFPVKKDHGGWIERFCKELKHKGLNDKVMWKINCRPDEVEKESFGMMKSNGLFLVFLGIEDGTDTGLKRLNKHFTVSKSMEGIHILKELGLGFDYGFMLFQPSSTYKSILDNLNFLRQLCGDGYTPVVFLKLMPYLETRVEKELREEGRIKGTPGFLDYDFLEESLNRYYEYITDAFMEWIRDPTGLLNISKWARNYLSVFSHYFKPSPDFYILSAEVRKTVSESNLFLLDTMKELAPIFESQEYKSDNAHLLKNIGENINLKHKYFRQKINNTIIKLTQIAVN